MSCKDCELADGGPVYWYRWKNANVGILGCKPHVLEVLDALNATQQVSS